jgi:cytochrome P450
MAADVESSRGRESRRAPSVGGHWLLGVAPEFARDPLGCMERVARQGDVVRLRFGPIEAHQLKNPEHIGLVLADPRTFNKQIPTYHRMRQLLGDGLITSDGAFWLKQRRIAQPAFHRERVAGFATVMVRAAEETAARWRALASDEPIDVAVELTALTLRVVCETLLGGDAPEEAREVATGFTEINQLLMRRLSTVVPWPLWVPVAENRRFRSALARLDGAVYRIIARRRAEPARLAERPDLLSMLMNAREEADGDGMSDTQLRDEVITILLAGHETTAVALSWALYLVARHPTVEARLRAELAASLGGRAPGFADLERLRYTRMVIEETMRLYPPVWIVGRGVSRDVHVDGYRLRRGTGVIFSPWIVHRSPSLWDEPDAFRPERFGEGGGPPHKHAYFPFLAGPRQCIGNGFAMMEAQLVLATLVQQLRFTAASDRPVEPEPLLTLRPRNGVWLRLSVEEGG